jgi:alanyl-tRNA synthetase
LLVPSSPLIPAGDPTLLLTSAGMVPFKPFFTGEEEPPSKRLTSVQKCFRATDIDSVGDETHLTLFEMLGNFSIGDYFKLEAIAWAWEFVTIVLGIPQNRLWVTVFQDDDEAQGIWANEIGVPLERIVRLGEKDNFWGPAGNEGPCGPCSELHYDVHPERGLNGEAPGDASGRFVEIWNLVFVQLYQHLDKSRTQLPAPGVDTGMGLERTAAVVQGVTSAYETDLFAPIVRRVESVSGKGYGDDAEVDFAIRVVAEHTRAACFLIADGVLPDKKDRGYITRRLIRRAMFYFAKYLNPDVYLADVADAVVDQMKGSYGELLDNWAVIRQVIIDEEKRFIEGLQLGTRLIGHDILKFSEALRRYYESENWQKAIQSDPQELWSSSALSRVLHNALLVPIKRAIANLPPAAQVSEAQRQQLLELTRTISGEAAFVLYSTYGFPLELTQEVATAHGLEVDVAGFKPELQADAETQRQRGRAAGRFGGERDLRRVYEALGVVETPFLGYERLEVGTVVEGLLLNGSAVEKAELGQEVEVVLRETPFYPEGGGQVADTGSIHHAGVRLEVHDTRKPAAGVIVHEATVTEGVVAVGDTVHAEVDGGRRTDIMRNHTATHLLHRALRTVLGSHVRQSGSLVAPDYLRFDFTHVGPVTPQEMDEIQRSVNDVVRRNLPADKRETTYREAIDGGALAFFGDRYPERVRTLAIGDFSYEVCGGTHVERSGDIGSFRITSEGGIGTGLRRIEAVTGRGADAWMEERLGWLEQVTQQLHTAAADAPVRVAALLREVAQARRDTAASQRDSSLREAEGLLAQVQQLDGVSMLSAKVDAPSLDALREMGDWLRDKMGSGIVVLGAVFEDRPSLIVMVTPDLVANGYKAGDIVKAAAQRMGGGGGGRPELAQAGGKEPKQLSAALDVAVELVRQQGQRGS